ncbi:hypothetical protein Sjap_022257 [Stephania japonica]|uniref:peptidylprolyl isomerase n=1 Tax=Stephania japonica TaxID=461633 RepID=A0AAP0ENL1_9MAGN
MAVSSLLATAPKMCSLLQNPKSNHSSLLSSSVETISAAKKRLFDCGMGLLAASMVLASPLEANATRIEYYATVGEPLCELNFVRSGLGYCDVAVGSGDEAPYNDLINIHYTARFEDGTVFDSSYKRGRPLTMRIGVGKGESGSFGFLQSWHMDLNLQDAFQLHQKMGMNGWTPCQVYN